VVRLNLKVLKDSLRGTRTLYKLSIGQCGESNRSRIAIVIDHLQGNQNSSVLQCEVAHWPALAVGSAVQFAAAHCSNERTLVFGPRSLQLDRPTYAPVSRTMAFT